MFRILFITFSGSFRGTEEQRHHVHESPSAMTIPLVLLAVLSIIGGFVGIPEVFTAGGDKLASFLKGAGVSDQMHGEVSHSTEMMLMAITTIIAIIAIVIAWLRYRKYKEEQTTA